MSLVLGLDVGTQGARAIVCTESGRVTAQASQGFGQDVVAPNLPPGHSEQNPECWWRAAAGVLREVVGSLTNDGFSPQDIDALAVDSTSGTVVPVDQNGGAVRPAIMYNDTRAVDEAVECNEAGQELTQRLGYRFGSSFGLPKVLWLKRHEPGVWERSARIAHAADYIVGRITGDLGKSDNSNCLKTGCDLAALKWPAFIERDLGIEMAKLPEIVSPGEKIGRVSAACAEETGLAEGTTVVGGVSDGTAGFVASGACGVGDWNSTIGTTLVLRGVSERIVTDPEGRIYCHRHPDGMWLPGGASSVGGECLAKLFSDDEYDSFNKAARELTPTNLLVYPLVRRGERLPFVDADAEGFVVGEVADRAELYTGYLEGVAYVERWCFELMEELGAGVGDMIYATGGGAKSVEWMQIRANVLKRCVSRPPVTESAFGAAVVAASRTLYSSLTEASRAMVTQDTAVEPEKAALHAYDERYSMFREECARRGLGVRSQD